MDSEGSDRGAALGEIEALRRALAESGADVADVPRVDAESPPEEAEYVLAVLRRRRDRMRGRARAGELLAAVAAALAAGAGRARAAAPREA